MPYHRELAAPQQHSAFPLKALRKKGWGVMATSLHSRVSGLDCDIIIIIIIIEVVVVVIVEAAVVVIAIISSSSSS